MYLVAYLYHFIVVGVGGISPLRKYESTWWVEVCLTGTSPQPYYKIMPTCE